MKWCIGRGYRTDNPAGAAVAAEVPFASSRVQICKADITFCSVRLTCCLELPVSGGICALRPRSPRSRLPHHNQLQYLRAVRADLQDVPFLENRGIGAPVVRIQRDRDDVDRNRHRLSVQRPEVPESRDVVFVAQTSLTFATLSPCHMSNRHILYIMDSTRPHLIFNVRGVGYRMEEVRLRIPALTTRPLSTKAPAQPSPPHGPA